MGLRTFTFGGTVSSDYDMFITDAAPYNAPERDVEMLSIPGRNGAFALDKGSFSNVEVTYHVVVYGSNHSGFQSALSNVRNWLCSAQGYQRLTDDYNPNEYRMAVYKGGLETKGDYWNGAEFDITFDCKPQRWLTSGETAVSVTSGDTLTNPTLFEAKPELQIWGYGTISIDGNEIELINQTIGPVEVYHGNGGNMTLDTTYANAGDSIYGEDYIGLAYLSATANDTITSATISTATDWSTEVTKQNKSLQVWCRYVGTLSYGTSTTKTQTFTISAVVNGSPKTLTYTVNVIYNGSDNIRITSSPGAMPAGWTKNSEPVKGSNIWLNSTTSTLGTPSYVDLDTGEAYMISGGSVASINTSVNMPSTLPTLAPGASTITFPNTVTQLKVVPRWWKV